MRGVVRVVTSSGGRTVYDEQGAFGFSRRPVGAATVVELTGELDILAAAGLSARFDALGRGPHPDIVVDLRGVTFIDCSGLSLLCRLRTRVLGNGGSVRLVSTEARFLRLLRLTRLSAAFAVHDDVASALAVRPMEETGPEASSGAIA